MITKAVSFLILVFSCATGVFGQGTLEFDQQSTTGQFLEGGYDIQSSQPIGQSFTPSLNAVGFIQLYLINLSSANSATVYVDLLANSITGPVLAQTMSVTVSPLDRSSVNFYFATPAAVSPGTTYYFQPVVPAGAADASVSLFYQYSGGTAFINGTADPTREFYFREGIVTTPEPSTWALLILGGGALLFRRRKG